MKTLLKPLSFLPALLMMYMIYSFSANTGTESSELSLKVSFKIVQAVDYVADWNLDDWKVNEYAQKIHTPVRKLAHMTEYALLAIAIAFPLYVYGVRGLLLMFLAGAVCIAFAAGDEYHQSFVGGRGPSLRDVAIDSIGAFIGIIFVRIIGWTGRMSMLEHRIKKRDKLKKKRRRDQDR